MMRYSFSAFLLRRCSSDRRRWTQSLLFEDLTAAGLAALRKIPVRGRSCRILEADGAANLSPVAAPKPDQSERDQNHQASTAPRFLAVWEMGDLHVYPNRKCLVARWAAMLPGQASTACHRRDARRQNAQAYERAEHHLNGHHRGVLTYRAPRGATGAFLARPQSTKADSPTRSTFMGRTANSPRDP